MVHILKNKLKAIAVTIFLMTLVTGGCSGEGQQISSADGYCQLAGEDLSWIRNMEAEHESQAAKADFDAMSGAFSGTVVTMPPNQPDIIGRTALREWQSQFLVGGCSDLRNHE